MDFILCSSAFVLCLVLRVNSQPPPKPIGEWSPNRAEMYPNPWVDSQGCKTQETSGLCDYNEMLNGAETKCSCLDEVGLAVTQPLIECKLGILTSWLSKVNKSLCLPWFDDVKKHILTPDPLGNCDGETKLSMPRRADGETRALDQQQRKYFSDQPELNKSINADRCLCNENCDEIRIIITMAIMKKIGPHITDYRAAAKEFAEKFRTLWSLNNCTVILVASKGDDTSFLDAGARVIELLSVNVTEKLDQDIYEKYFSEGRFVEGLNTTLSEYRNYLKQMQEQKSPGVKIIVGVIICILLVAIVAIIVVIVIKRHKSKMHKLPAEDKAKQSLNAPEAV